MKDFVPESTGIIDTALLTIVLSLVTFIHI